MIRYRAMSLAMGVVGAAMFASCSAAVAEPASFAASRAEFERLTKALDVEHRGEVHEITQADFNTLLERTRGAIDKDIPPENAPLRAYVDKRLPPLLTGGGRSVPAREATDAIQTIRALFQKLDQVKQFTMDLTIKSVPSGALAELSPAAGNKVATTTDETITNLYRGEYDYVVRKAGYKDVKNRENFIDRAGTVLECDLVKKESPDDSTPCRLH